MELQSIAHVWINHDNDLVDLTITSTHPSKDGTSEQSTSEVIHTNQKHPFLTTEKGFVPVKALHVGMHVRKADGSLGVITAWKVVPGSATMYNLTVEQDQTFAVGDGQWVVHNCGEGEPGSNSNPEVPGNLGRGTILNHFTDVAGATGITGVDASSLDVGQQVTVQELHFGQGINQFMADTTGDIFVTELSADATPGQLERIGVFGEKQSFVIQFSQEAAFLNDARPIPQWIERSIFSLPGGSILKGFDFILRRLR